MTSIRAKTDILLTILAGWPRRLAAMLCLVGAGLSALGSGAGHRVGELVPVVVTARPLTAGAQLSATDVRTARWPAGDAPANATVQAGQVIGRRVAVAMARGEPVSLGALLEPAIASALAAGRVATTVTLSDVSQAAILRSGAVVDLYAGSDNNVVVEGKTVSGSESGRPLAEDVQVLSVLSAPTGSAQPPDASTVSLVVAIEPGTAARLADNLSGTFLATLVQPR
ncbi:MAG: SAF domain-containing protein [Jatrophihabitans sp.]